MELRPLAVGGAVLVAVLAVAALGMQFAVSLSVVGTVRGTLWTLGGYFTILTNTLVALSVLSMALSKRSLSPAWLAGLTLWILIVGVVYHLLLAKLWAPEGLAWWADQALHSAVPVAMFIWWFAFAPKSGLRPFHAVLWLGWPFIYTFYALVRAQITGTYPYPFIDLNVLTAVQFALNVLGLLVGFFIGGLAIVGLTHAMPDSRQSARPGSSSK